jgi:RimJ/RimL family protein N-acetyltransferase
MGYCSVNPVDKGSQRTVTEKIPDATVDALARNIYKEASAYGFQQVDIIRLINGLMDLCMGTEETFLESLDDRESEPRVDVGTLTELPLVSSDIIIRAFNGPEDRELLEQWLPDRYGRFFVLSCATAQEITIDALVNSPRNHLGIVTLPDGKPIGAMAYLDHSRKQQRAELRKLIGDLNARGKGRATQATRLWVQYGIHGLGLQKIYVSTLQTQIANIKLNESIGFQVEGLLKNEVLIDGERCDVLRMGLSAKST